MNASSRSFADHLEVNFQNYYRLLLFINDIIEKSLSVIYTTIKYVVLFLLIMIWKM